MTKFCNKCNTVREMSEFNTDNTKPDKRASNCKHCKRKYNLSQTTKDRRNAAIRKGRKECPQKCLYLAAKSRAKKKKILFNLELSDIVIPEICPILKIPLTTNDKVHGENSMSIDRIFPHLGYVKNNIQVISHKANRMKNSATLDELELFARWVLDELLSDKRIQKKTTHLVDKQVNNH